MSNDQAFVASYTRNRIRSFLHQWYSLFDDRRRGAMAVSELFADQFEIVTPEGVVSRKEDFHAQYERAGVGLLASSHHLQACRIVPASSGTYDVELEIFYQRLSLEGVCVSVMFFVDTMLEVTDAEIRMRRYVARLGPRQV